MYLSNLMNFHVFLNLSEIVSHKRTNQSWVAIAVDIAYGCYGTPCGANCYC